MSHFALIIAAVAEFERERTRERIMLALDRRRSRGDRLGPQPGRVSRVDPCPCVSASGSPKEVDILRQDDQLAAAAHQPARTYSPGVSRAAMSRRSAAAEPDRDSPQIGHRT